MPLLHNPLSRLGKTESKYEFELTVQALRMADSVNPSKELVYVEISRGGKRFKTSNIVHTGDISWDDTFLFVSTLYKSDTHLAGAAAQFEPKEYMVALLEYNSMRRQGPKVLCKARLNLALFAAAGHEGKDVPVTCYLLDRAGRQSAILTLAVRSKWLADTKLDTGRGLARFKTSSGDVGLDVGADGGVRAQDSLRVPSGGGGGSGIPARTGRLSGRRSGEDEDDSASSSGSVSTAWTRSTAASSAIGGTTLIPASASGASNFRGSMGSEAASAADACADGSCSAPHAVGACGGCAVGSAGSVAGAAVQPATHAAGVSASVPGAGACAGASGAGPAGGGGSGASAAASAAACAGAATDGATGEFVPSLHRIDSTEELASLVSKSPSQRAQTAEHDALLLDHALRLRDAPPAERYTHQGLPVAALLIARYSIEVRSSRFTVAACAALRARLHAHARQPAALAYELSVLSVLLALARGHLLARTGVAAHPAGAGPSFGLGLGLEPPRDVRAGKGGGALSTSAARVLEHEQRVLANFCSEVLRLSASALELFLRPVLLDLGPRLGPALLEAALSAESAARAHTEQQRLAAALRGASDALFAANVPPPAVRALVLRVARFVGAQAFNSLALRRELCTSGNGVQIKLALAVLERWVEDVGARCAQLDVGAARTPPRARSAGAQRRAAAHASRGSSSGGGRGRECAHTSAALEALAHVRQAADIFIVDKAVLLSDEDRAQVCPALSAAQLGHMLRMFTADEWTPSALREADVMRIVERAAAAEAAKRAGARGPHGAGAAARSRGGSAGSLPVAPTAAVALLASAHPEAGPTDTNGAAGPLAAPADADALRPSPPPFSRAFSAELDLNFADQAAATLRTMIGHEPSGAPASAPVHEPAPAPAPPLPAPPSPPLRRPPPVPPGVLLDPYSADKFPVEQLRRSMHAWQQRGLHVGPLSRNPLLRFLEGFEMSTFLPPLERMRTVTSSTSAGVDDADYESDGGTSSRLIPDDPAASSESDDEGGAFDDRW